MKRRRGYDQIRHWSPDHQFFAAAIAARVVAGLDLRRYVVPDDLIDWAWLSALRFRRANELSGCGTVVARIMREEALTMLIGRNRYSRWRYPGEPLIESEPQCNPIETLMEQDQCQQILTLLADEDRQFIQTFYGITYKRESDWQMARRLHITRSGVHARKKRILDRLRAKVA